MDITGILASIVVAVGMFIWGRLKGKKDSARHQLERNAEAHDRAREVKDEVGSLSDDAVTDRLRKRARK